MSSNKPFIIAALLVAFLIHSVLAHAGVPLSVTPLPAPELPPINAATVQVPSPAPDLSAYEGKPVRAAEVVFDEDPWDDIKPRPLRMVHIGDPFRAEIARTAMLEALANGLAGNAKVNVFSEGDGVHIRVHAIPRRVIDGLRVELHRAQVDREEILHESQLEEGGEILGSEIAARKKRIEVVLARHGFPQAQAEISTRGTDTEGHVLVLLDVNVGQPRKVARRIFYPFGAKPADLEPFTKQYDIDEGDRIDEAALQQADLALENKLRAAGWYEAAVKHDIVLVQYASGAVITLRVRIDSGPRYFTRFDGNAHYDADALTSALALESDPDTGEQHLADKIRRFYVARAFLDVIVTSELRGKPTDESRYLVLHVREGRRTAVTARQYPCVRDQDIAHLDAGGPSSASAIGREIDSFLDEDLPGADFVSDPDPRAIDRDLGGGGGTRSAPIDLDPSATYSPETYDKGIQHVQELYRNEGFMSALVGPVQVMRRQCDPHSPPGRCVPMPFTQQLPEACNYDRSGLPTPVAPLDASFTCTPDPTHGVECEPAVRLRIPIRLGPRTSLSDVAFFGAKSISEKELADSAALDLGKPVSTLKVDEARRRVVDRYREEGFYYADVKYDVQRSLDNTQARARFDVNEGDRVVVTQIVIQGNAITNESVIRRRVALKIGEPFRTSDVRKTQERIATLNVFTSVSVVLQDAQVPQKRKTVIITVSEKPTQYLEPSLGFSTGEGARGSLEYGYTNLFGSAISAVIRARVSYLPDFLISDPTILQNFQKLSVGDRIAYRVTLSLGFPDIGLGPDVRANLDGVYLQDVERYFIIDKAAFIPTAVFRPIKQHAFALTVSAEYNNLNVFNNQSPAEAVALSGGNLDVQRLLRAPAGQSAVLSQRLLWTWDRRDNAFNAHKGTFFSLNAEHVNWWPLGVPANETICTICSNLNQVPLLPQTVAPTPGHFLKLGETFSGYFPLPFYKKITVAATLRIGAIVQLASGSTTYPDRFYFMGGIDSLRSYLQDSMMPQDAADQIDEEDHHTGPGRHSRRQPPRESARRASHSHHGSARDGALLRHGKSVAGRVVHLQQRNLVPRRRRLRYSRANARGADCARLWNQPHASGGVRGFRRAQFRHRSFLEETSEHDAGDRAARDEPRRVDAKAEEHDRADDGDDRGRHVDDGRDGELHGDHRHQCDGRRAHAVEKRAGALRASDAREERSCQSDEREARKKNRNRGYDRARHAAHEITDERRAREHGARRDLTDGDRVEELRFGEPMESHDEIVAQEREQHVAAPEHERADLQEREEQSEQARVRGGRRDRGRDDHRARCVRILRATRDGGRRAGREQNPKRRHAERGCDRRTQSDRTEPPRTLHRFRREARERLRDHADHDGLHAVEHTRHLRQRSESRVRPCEREHDQRGRRDEAHTTEHEPEEAGALVPDVDRHLRRARTRDEIRRCEQFEKPLVRQPFSATNEFVLHDRDVRGGSAECGQPEPQKRAGDFPPHYAGCGACVPFVFFETWRACSRTW